MDSDNLYPRSGAYRPTEPSTQVADRAKESAQTLKAMPIIEDLLIRFEEKIAFYGSVESVPEEVLTIPDEFMHIVAANKIIKGLLEAELDYLRDLVKTHVS